MNRLQSLAVWGALLPMAGGLSILGLFVLTDEDLFPLLGLMWLWVGFAMNVATTVLAVAGHLRARRDGVARAQRWRVTACLLALIVANWATAAGCLLAGVAWGTRYMLELDNRHTAAWDNVELRAPGVERVVSVPGGEAVTMWLWFHGDGELTLRRGSEQVVIEDYVSSTGGGGAKVAREPDGAVRLVPRSD